MTALLWRGSRKAPSAALFRSISPSGSRAARMRLLFCAPRFANRTFRRSSTPPRAIAPAPRARRRRSICSAFFPASLRTCCSSWPARLRSSAISISPLSSRAWLKASPSTGSLTRLAEGLTVDWLDGAARALVQVEQGMRRNLLRSLSLDAMAVSLGGSE
ncbi:hypothetical protein SBA5_470086 [Candidatus Sulfotelmatomonas gaucii]|uniref:Uncharacterized protein n=1 Tax=Candidatus Sulfuritelmatomonas gaucii TaxID=2043161 RepID=A0A2N9LPF1_9BACT|nr:hypothetical protein SBA5_470086 [Candidatus Sulfotelmatomonas gaucii]